LVLLTSSGLEILSMGHVVYHIETYCIYLSNNKVPKCLIEGSQRQLLHTLASAQTLVATIENMGGLQPVSPPQTPQCRSRWSASVLD
jgi:hypothetical protein